MNKMIDMEKSSGYFVIKLEDGSIKRFDLKDMKSDHLLLNIVARRKPDPNKVIKIKNTNFNFILIENKLELNIIEEIKSNDYNEQLELDENKILTNKNDFKKSFNYSDNCVNYLYYYFPRKKENREKISNEILDLKIYKSSSKYFKIFLLTFKKYVINEILKRYSGFVICCVPSSDKKYFNINDNLMSLTIRIITKDYRNVIDGSQVLFRRETIIPAHIDSSSRNFNIQYKSLDITNKEIIKNKVVLLVDDICTSGNSLKACKAILEENGAAKVMLFTIAKTMN